MGRVPGAFGSFIQSTDDLRRSIDPMAKINVSSWAYLLDGPKSNLSQ